ncbi:MAG: AAA-like domain-containing protein [Caldilineaceae bacterium]
MRIFNTSGPCDPAKHYTVMREELVAKGQALVAQGRYFTIFAPRQAGKTTYFQLLLRQLATAGYTPIWISFEGLKTLTRERFYKALHHNLKREFAQYGIHSEQTIVDQFDIQLYLEQVSVQAQAIVLVIDEFEDIPDAVLSELMHIFRALYQKREYHKLHSLVLVGVSTVAELVLSSASPFNVVDELRIPYFTFTQIQELITQHTVETGQVFELEVVKAISENTAGQPGLVCALCHYLVTDMVPDRSQPVTMAAFYPTLTHFLTDRFDKNIVNIVQKAREKQEFMLRVLFDDNPIPFTVNDPTIAYLYAHGVIANIDGYVDIPIPLYSKSLITAFRPLINGESKHYVTAHDTFRDYLTGDGINVNALLTKYCDYVRRRGFHAFDTNHLKEGAWHYSLDGFINFFIQRLGGDTLIETPSGRGRTDILILYQQQKYLIETKIFTDQSYFQNGKHQLADYLTTEGLSEGYYVVFSNKHSATDMLSFDEMIDGKRIYTYIILTNFEKPSRRRVRKQ